MAERFEIPGAHAETIRGYVHLPDGTDPAPVVLLAHGFKGFADYGFLPLMADRLAEAGFAVVRFSFSHCGIAGDGESFDRPDLFERDTFGNQIVDTRAVIEAVRAGALPGADRLDGDRIAMVGHSRGGVTAVLMTGATDKLKAVVTLAAPNCVVHDEQLRRTIAAEGRAPSPSARTGEMLYIGPAVLEDIEAAGDLYDLFSLLACYAGPYLAVHAEGDETVPSVAAERLAASHAEGPTELMIVPGSGHTFDFKHGQAGSTPALDAVVAKIVEFLKTHLV